MRIKAVAQLNVLQLFVHDAYDVGQFDESLVADALTRYLREETTHWNEVKVDPPSGLSRFTLGDIKRRLYSIQEVRNAFCCDVVEALERLNTGVWTLTDGGQFERA